MTDAGMKLLTSLEEHNSRKSWHFTDWNKPVPTGIACPKCREEMMNNNPGMMNASNPPSSWIDCPKCGHRDLMR